MAARHSLRELVRGYISEKKQFPDDSTALLTVSRVGTFSDRGSLDFGGSEYTEAQVKWLRPQKSSEDDSYGWWQLSDGMYVIELNESVDPPAGTHLLLHIWEDAQRAGIVHPTLSISGGEGAAAQSQAEAERLRVTVTVGSTGVAVKENARISKLVLL